MKVCFAPRARADAQAIRDWWRLNGRQNKKIFGQELREARLTLEAAPKFGRVFAVEDGETIRTFPMLKTKCSLYYTVDEVRNVVEIVHIWSPVKGAPDL